MGYINFVLLLLFLFDGDNYDVVVCMPEQLRPCTADAHRWQHPPTRRRPSNSTAVATCLVPTTRTSTSWTPSVDGGCESSRGRRFASPSSTSNWTSNAPDAARTSSRSRRHRQCSRISYFTHFRPKFLYDMIFSHFLMAQQLLTLKQSSDNST